MRETFILDNNKNNGYPTFTDAKEFDSFPEWSNSNMFICGNNYPTYKNKSYLNTQEIVNSVLWVSNNKYPMPRYKDYLNTQEIINSVLYVYNDKYPMPKDKDYLNTQEIVNSVLYGNGIDYLTPKNKYYLDTQDIVNSVMWGNGIDYLDSKYNEWSLISGAFYKSVNLNKIIIPNSVKLIGEHCFTETNLKNISISADCVYYDTSFPTDCIINKY